MSQAENKRQEIEFTNMINSPVGLSYFLNMHFQGKVLYSPYGEITLVKSTTEGVYFSGMGETFSTSLMDAYEMIVEYNPSAKEILPMVEHYKERKLS